MRSVEMGAETQNFQLSDHV